MTTPARPTGTTTIPAAPTTTAPPTTTTVPAGADMPATITNGVRPAVEVVGRGEYQRRLRMAERNLAALDAHVTAHPEAAKAVMDQRATYEAIAEDARLGLNQQNRPQATTQATTQASTQSTTAPARTGDVSASAGSSSGSASTGSSASPSSQRAPDIADGEE